MLDIDLMIISPLCGCPSLAHKLITCLNLAVSSW